MKKLSKEQEELLLEIMEISETIGVFKSDFDKAISNNSSDVNDIREDMFNVKLERAKIIDKFRNSILSSK
jgi:hypothetical protein